MCSRGGHKKLDGKGILFYEIEARNVPQVVLRNLGVRFRNERDGSEVEALRNVNLIIDEGEFVCIVGASGCGKTTLLRVIDGLTRPTEGEVLLGERQVVEPSSKCAFVFQTDALFPWRTVVDNVVFGLEVQRESRARVEEVAREFIELVGLAGFEKLFPHELSGGMRQRVNLARALAINPQVLLMDEPFASLDAQTREIMQLELLHIWSSQKKTVLFVTHQIEEAVYLADRVIVLSARPGRVKEIIPSQLPRPRLLTTKRSPYFTEMVGHIWDSIQAEVILGMGLRSERVKKLMGLRENA